jgi:large subunit ribosomal protein L31
MKAEIHPEYGEATITCACGNSWTTRSTKPEIHVDVCSNCHPFFTGEQRIVDTAGRVERFRRRYANAQQQAEPAAADEAPQDAEASSEAPIDAESAAEAEAETAEASN